MATSIHLKNSSSSNYPFLELQNNDSNSNSGEIRFIKKKSASDDDQLGLIKFEGYDNTTTLTEYAQIKVTSDDVSNNSEDGKLIFSTMQSDTDSNTSSLMELLAIKPREFTFGPGPGISSGKVEFNILAPGNTCDAYLYLGTQYGATTSYAKKTAIVAEGQNTDGKAKLHFCLNNDSGNGNVSTSANYTDDSIMTIIPSGNVGIGITSPEEKLVIGSGNILIPQNYSANGQSGKLMFYSNPGFSYAGINYIGGPSGNEQDGSYLNFFTGNSSSMCILQDGNVGIGITDPDSLFTIKTGSNGGATVFEYLTNDEGGGFKGVWQSNTPSGQNYNLEIYMKDDDATGYHKTGYFENDNERTSTQYFTGQHINILNTNITTLSIGLIVSSSGNYLNTDNSLNCKINESLPICILSNIDNDKKVFGIISDKEDLNSSREYGSGTYVSVNQKKNINEQRVFINSLGEGAIWVCNKNGSLDNGDYITSTTVQGYGMKQTLNESLLANYTVAKITCDCSFSLTKIVKQKLKVTTTTDDEGNTTTAIDYDINGDVQYEDELDEQGNQQMVYPLETRFLDSSGNQLVDETDYTTRLGNGESVYIACFVGCTYHCG